MDWPPPRSEAQDPSPWTWADLSNCLDQQCVTSEMGLTGQHSFALELSWDMSLGVLADRRLPLGLPWGGGQRRRLSDARFLTSGYLHFPSNSWQT